MKKTFKMAFIDTIPVLTGYLVLGFGFGIMLKSAGIVFLPAIISCVLVGATYVWKRNTLISIVLGTLCYMFLVQIVF